MEATDIRILGDLQRLALGPDDAVVLTCPQNISDETAARLTNQFEAHFPGRRVMVLGNGLQMAAIGPDDRLDRIESMLRTLVQGLAEEGEEAQPQHTLDGERIGGERDDSKPL